jgi:hypothetical protein
MPIVGVPYALLAFALLLAPVLVIWMVYSILKNAIPSSRTFEECWYEDVPRTN